MATRRWAGCWRYRTFAGEAFDMEMLGLDPKHFALAWLPTFMAVNDRLLCGVVRVLRMGHWKETAKALGEKEKCLENCLCKDV